MWEFVLCSNLEEMKRHKICAVSGRPPGNKINVVLAWLIGRLSRHWFTSSTFNSSLLNSFHLRFCWDNDHHEILHLSDEYSGQVEARRCLLSWWESDHAELIVIESDAIHNNWISVVDLAGPFSSSFPPSDRRFSLKSVPRKQLS